MHKILISCFLFLVFEYLIFYFLFALRFLNFIFILCLRKYLINWFLKESLWLSRDLIQSLTLYVWIWLFILLWKLNIFVLQILFLIFTILKWLFLVIILFLGGLRRTIQILLFLFFIIFAFFILLIIWYRIKINTKSKIFIIYSLNNILALNWKCFLKMERFKHRKQIKT